MDSLFLINLRRFFNGFFLYSFKTILLFVFVSLSACASLMHVSNGSEFRSPDGSKVARVENGTVVINGKKSLHEYDGINIHGVVFTSDAQHVAYIGHKEGKRYLVIDEVEYGPYEGISTDGILISPSGNNVVLSIYQGDKWSVVINGKKGNEYDGIMKGIGSFSDDGDHFAYAARRKSKWLIVNNGFESEEFDAILDGTPFYSSDEKLIYSSLSDNQWRIHIGNWESKPYDLILLPGIILSPDKTIVAFVGTRNGKKIAVIDCKEEASYENIGIWRTSGGEISTNYMFLGGFSVMPLITGSPLRTDLVSLIIFSSDSQHYAYPVLDGKVVKIIIDGAVVKELPEKSTVEGIEFSKDSNSLVYKLKDNEIEQVIELQNP